VGKTQFLMLQQVVVHIVTTRLLRPRFVQKGSPCGKCGGKSGTWTVFPPTTQAFRESG